MRSVVRQSSPRGPTMAMTASGHWQGGHALAVRVLRGVTGHVPCDRCLSQGAGCSLRRQQGSRGNVAASGCPGNRGWPWLLLHRSAAAHLTHRKKRAERRASMQRERRTDCARRQLISSRTYSRTSRRRCCLAGNACGRWLLHTFVTLRCAQACLSLEACRVTVLRLQRAGRTATWCGTRSNRGCRLLTP